MSAVETVPGVALVAARKLKCDGSDYAPGEVFHVLDPERAALLVRSGYASAAPEGAEVVARQQAREHSARIRHEDRPPPAVSLRDRPAPEREAEVLTLLDLADRTSTVSHPGLREALVVAEDRLAALEARAAGEAAPKRKQRQPPVRQRPAPVPVVDVDDVVLEEEG